MSTDRICTATDCPRCREDAEDADKRDAARYRWLRTHPNYMGWEHDFRPEEVDVAIDAEIARGEHG